MESLERLVEDAIGIWTAGGWAMIALAVNALILFGLGTNLWLNFKSSRYRLISGSTWRRWIDHPKGRHGWVGEVIEFVMTSTSIQEMHARFAEINHSQLASFDRDLKFMKRAVSVAPLLGLLGTVTGMLATFGALGSGAGGEKTMDMVAGGISEALITTETGLVIALPGLFFQYVLTRQRDRYEAFLAHLESACALKLWAGRRAA